MKRLYLLTIPITSICFNLIPGWALGQGESNQQKILDETIVIAPKSKREIKRLQEELSDQLIAKLNEGASEDDTITCKKTPYVINSKGGKELLRVCHRNITHIELDKIDRDYQADYAMYNCAKEIFSSGTTPSICKTLAYKRDNKKQTEKKEESKNINKRINELAKTDPKFSELLKKAKMLEHEYKNRD